MSHSLVLDSLSISGLWLTWLCFGKNIFMSGQKISSWERQRRVSLILPSTQEGRALVVPATCPGKQEHLTVWERSSILFLLQQRWAATTSQVPVLSCFDPEAEDFRGKVDHFSYYVLHISRDGLSDFIFSRWQNYIQIIMILDFIRWWI